MIIKNDEPLWCEKYRPQTVADTILPKALKATFQSYVDEGFIPNITLTGGPGVGKTTAAMAALTELGAEYYFINSSMKGNIDTLRTDLAEFASSVSFTGGRKYILMDEADYLNAQSTQPALRGFIEMFSRNCGFILTCNFPSRLLEAILSRCPVIDFAIPAEEKIDLATQFFMRMQEILEREKVEYDEAEIAAVLEYNFPDWRKMINILQNSTKNKKITTDISIVSDDDIKKLFRLLKEQDFTKTREWCAEHGNSHPADLFKVMYGFSNEFMSPMGQAQLALTISKYEYNAAFVANQEINLVAAMVEMMTECEWK